MDPLEVENRKMSERELRRAVARVTGETVTEIAHRGFQETDLKAQRDQDLKDYRIDWDALIISRFSDPFLQGQPRLAIP